MTFKYYEARKELEQEIIAEIGEAPDKEYKYYAYKNGNVVECKSRDDAYKFSKNVESVCVNEAEIKEYWKMYNEKMAVLNLKWHAELREEYSHLNDAVYSLVYSLAYDEGHSAGYDEVANYMSTYSDFAEKVIAASKK